MNTDTPRTNQVIDMTGYHEWSRVWAGSHRQLERELNAANAEIERLKNQPHEIICTKCGLREERGEKPKAEF